MPRRATLNSAILEAALTGLESQKQHLDDQIAAIRAMLGARPRTATPAQPAARRKRTISAAGKKRIAEAARKRWAEWRQNQKRQ